MSDLTNWTILPRSASAYLAYSSIFSSSSDYIDGQTVVSGRVPVLKYDEATGTYSGPGL